MDTFKKFFPIIAIVVGVVGVVVGGFIFYISLFDQSPVTTPTTTGGEQTSLPQRGGFAQLVSFTNNGFEPKEATIQATETVRFINNSSSELWVEGVGSRDNPLYPETGDCSSTAFDSCKALAPGEVWEFEFDEKGTWLFRNKLKTDQVGVMYVQ